MAEMWDAYDEQFQKIKDITLIRGEAIPEGMYHLVTDIIVKHNDGTYLLMQRDWNKKFGGTWELSAGGAALQGENPLDCALRELKEETGIVVSTLEEVGRVVDSKHQTLYVEFLCHTNWDKNSILLQEGETIAYKWKDLEQILNMDDIISNRAIDILKTMNFL